MGKTLSAFSLSPHRLRRERAHVNPIAAFTFLLSLLTLLPVKAAFAASTVTVSVQQSNSGSPAQTVTCALNAKCVLPFTLNAGQADAQSINIQIAYVPLIVAFRFQGSNGYFYTGDAGNKGGLYTVQWAKPIEGNVASPYQVVLIPPTRQTGALPVLNIGQDAASYAPVATLGITLTQVP